MLTRRQFSLALSSLPFASLAQDLRDGPWNEPATVARVYLAAEKPHWPNTMLDVPAEVRSIEDVLAAAGKKHAQNVRFTGGEVISNAASVAGWAAKLGDVDGVLIIPVTQPVPALREVVDALPAPALYYSRPYAGHSWASIADLQKSGKRIDVVATSDPAGLDPYLKAFRTVRHMKKSKVLVGTATPGSRQAVADGYSKQFGTAFKFVTGPEFRAAFEAADERKARREAAAFIKSALQVIDTSRQEIDDGVRFYHALAEMLRQEKANALTIDCFGTLAANTLPGYPCIAWSKFNDAGLYGVCEADLPSTMTQILVTSYSGMPGFVSDPVFDLSRNEVIHAHCVSATKMKGIHTPSMPYKIRKHLETNEGAVLEVVMPPGGTMTVARFTSPKKLLVSTAECLGHVDSDRGCRTQVRTRVSDAGKWLRNYTAGLHRVVFYGNHVPAIERFGRLMGFEVVHEV